VSLLPDINSLDLQIECEVSLDLESGDFSGFSLSSKGLQLITPQQFCVGSILMVSIMGEHGLHQNRTAVVAASEPSPCHSGGFFTTVAFVDELAGDFCGCSSPEDNAVVLPA